MYVLLMCVYYFLNLYMDNNTLTVLDLLRRSIDESNWDYVESALSILEESDNESSYGYGYGYDEEYDE